MLQRLKEMLDKTTHDDVKQYMTYLNEIIAGIEGDGGFFLNSEKLRKYYTYSRIGFFFDLLNLVEEKIGVRNKDICDMASGGGVLANLLFKYYNTKITSIDALESGIKFGALHTPEATWINDDMFNLEGEYDLVFACEVIEHVVNPIKVIDQMLARVKSGGDLVVTVPDGRIDKEPAGTYSKATDAYSGHINFWSIENFGTYFGKYKPEVFYLQGRGDERASKICAFFHKSDKL